MNKVVIPTWFCFILLIVTEVNAGCIDFKKIQRKRMNNNYQFDYSGWSEIWRDDFNGNSLNESYWHIKTPWGDAVAASFQKPENVIVQNGYLFLKVDRDTTTKVVNWPAYQGLLTLGYSGADIWSKLTFKYGYFEAYVRFPSGKGLAPAYWLYGEKCRSAAGAPHNNKNEIDIIEFEGAYPYQYNTDIHCSLDGGFINPKDVCQDHELIYPRANLTTGFHKFGMEWNPEGMVWYFDDKIVRFECNQGRIVSPMSIILSNVVNQPNGVNGLKLGNWDGPPNNTNSFPAYFIVDYVSVYTLDNCTADQVVWDDSLCAVPAELRAYNSTFVRNLELSNQSRGFELNSNESYFGKAAQSITLKPGTHLRNGAYFHALLDVCTQRKRSNNISSSASDRLIIKEMNRAEFMTDIPKGSGLGGDLSIYPNPSENQFTVHSNKTLESLEIASVNGRLLKSYPHVNQSKITIRTQLPNGIYLLKTRNVNGEVFIKKIVIF